MAPDVEQATEHSSLLPHDRRFSTLQHEEAHSILSSHVTKEERALGSTAVGERLPYNDYTTIDWLHDKVKESFRFRLVHSKPGLRHRLLAALDDCQEWFAAAIIGILTACVAFLVDIAVATVEDWKLGYCKANVFASRQSCCTKKSPLVPLANLGDDCRDWQPWSDNYGEPLAIFIGFALAFGIISSSLTMLTKRSLPAASPGTGDGGVGKSMYMAAGSGIPEIKTILSGFVIPHFLDFKVMAVKGIGAIFAVSSGMCLGKEGPFVHISTCVSYLVAMWFPKYKENGRELREMLAAGCSSGLSVVFGAPIGGVLFSYEEISTYFPRRVLWRAFLASLFSAVVLRELNPTGTGRLVLFETDYGIQYKPVHYLVFIFLGIVGGIFGGIFCKANFLWSRTFRQISVIKNNPVFEVALVVLATALFQYPNPMTREPGDVIIKDLLVACRGGSQDSWVCEPEAGDNKARYIGWLVYGTLVKLMLTIITFGCKVPSGIIIPAMNSGAFFGRLIGQVIPDISPGIFAMVGSVAFLAGVSRMTISLVVIMFELTGELDYTVPHMVAVMVAKWVADALEKEGVYDLAQTVLGHPFLDIDHEMSLVQQHPHLAEELIPPAQTMHEITVDVPDDGRVPRKMLEEKLEQLQRRGLMDAGLVLVQKGMLQGYLDEGELQFGLNDVGRGWDRQVQVRLLGHVMDDDGEFDMSMFVDRTPLTICAKAPMEYVLEMYGKLGLRYLCVLEEGSGKVVGVIIKKRLVMWLENLKKA